MLERIVAILFPVFAITAIGYFVALKKKPDMAHTNRLIADVFVPALVFGALASRDFHIYAYRWLALSMLCITIGCGFIGWALAAYYKLSLRTVVPPMMFSNSVNLGVPVAVLAFGERAFQPAIVLFLISSLLHYSFGLWLLDHKARLSQMWRVPSLMAMLAGMLVSLLGIQVWEPAVGALKMLGDISIPLMLFALGVRMTDISLHGWRLGVVAGLVRPAAGMLLSFGVAELLGITGFEKSLLVIYGALPPAVMNYIFSERYNADPDRVASIVLLGNLLSVIVLPVALALAL
jgi:predicted permease